MANTEYVVDINYRLNGNAGKELDQVSAKADKANKGLSALKSALLGFGAGFVMNQGLGRAKEAFIGFNAEIEQSKLSLATITHMNLGGSFVDAKKSADELFKGLQEDAKATPATTKELVQFAAQTENAMLRAGLSMKQVRDLTTGAVVAAKTFGIAGEVAGLDIEQALSGTLSKRDRFARALLEPMGYSTEKFNAMDAKKRAEALTKALTSPSVKAAQKEYENSFNGVTTTLQDNLEIAAGKVGLPLFKAITTEVKKWNDWISKNPEKIEEFATKFSGALVTGFDAVKTGAGFLLDHKEELLAIAVAYKGAGVVSAAAGGLSGLAGAGATAAIGTIGAITAAVIGTAAVGAAIGALIAKYQFDKDEPANQSRKKADQFTDFTTRLYAGTEDAEAARRKLLENNKLLYTAQLHGLGAGPGGSQEILRGLVGASHDEVMKDLAPTLAWIKGSNAVKFDTLGRPVLDEEAIRVSARSASPGLTDLTEQRAVDAARRAFALGGSSYFDPEQDKRTKGMAPNINVRIDRIEVASDDPDRFAMGLSSSFSKISKAPTQAAEALRGTM